MAWTRGVQVFPDSLPLELGTRTAFGLLAAGCGLSAASFAAAGGRGNAKAGLFFGVLVGSIGLFASRWPQLAGAIKLGGGIFAGPFLSFMLAPAFTATAAGVAAALLMEEARPHARSLALAVVALWAAPTLATEAALARWWGFGPRSLAEAAGLPTNRESEVLAVVRLSPYRGRSTSRETQRMAVQTVDASPESLAQIEAFLRSSGLRGVFAGEALAALRQGWMQWWDAEKALESMMISAAGRAHPDYRRALNLIKAGPLTPERYGRLGRLAAEASASGAGLEDVGESQYIFEGFIAAYARFGDEANARKWLSRADNLLMVSDRRLEVTPLEDFREGQVAGSLEIDGRPAKSALVGLFLVWKSSGSRNGAALLSDSAAPDDDGRFSFSNLGSGEYELALLGRPQDLAGRVRASPGTFEIGYDRPIVRLPPIRIERELTPVPQAFSPGGLPEPPVPEPPEPLLRWPRR